VVLSNVCKYLRYICGLWSMCILYEACVICVRSDDNQTSSEYLAKKYFEESLCAELAVVYQWCSVSL
jgi:hypothetical protein